MPEKKIVFIAKNFSYTILSNLLSLIISSLVVTLVPKILSIENYGYFQIYLFYISYVGFLQFGWIDGIYLRYGGAKYKNLNKAIFAGQFVMLGLLQCIIGVVIILYSAFFKQESITINIVVLITFCMIITNLRGFLLYVLQSTFRIKEYAIVTTIGRVLYLILIVIVVLLNIDNYYPVMIAEILGRILSLGIACLYCKDMVFFQKKIVFDFKETWSNISVGIKLMCANIANLLIIGIIRWGIQINWDVTIFAKVSLVLSISSLLITFITAVGAVMFPLLRRIKKENLPYIFYVTRDSISYLLYFALLLYFPIRIILTSWLPQYEDSLGYMAILFPMCIYSGKSILLGNSFLNVLREEKKLMDINIYTVILSVISTILLVFILGNLTFTIVSIVVLLAIRMLLTEVFITNVFHIDTIKENIMETILTIIFMYFAWNYSHMQAMIIYMLSYFTYLIICRKKIQRYFNFFKNVMK